MPDHTITGEGLRESLEKDFLELERSNLAGNWKSVHVLAGSIVEALLVDTLLSLPGWSGKNPLEMQLAEIITNCKQEKIMSDRAADLCSVLRSYRNLIHPGRLVRLKEALPDETSAAVALALVKMIVDEVAQKRRTVVGLTADQVISKIVRDHNANSILKHLLNEVSEKQRRRLLLDLLPAEYDRACEDLSGDESRLEVAFRTIFDSSDDSVKKDAAAAAVAVIREADGDSVERYIKAFFIASDLEFVLEKDRPMVVDHLLTISASSKQLMHQKVIDIWSGLFAYLTEDTVGKWVNEYVRCIVYSRDNTVRANARTAFTWEACSLKDILQIRLDQHLSSWRSSFSNKRESAQIIEDLQQEIQSLRDIIF